MGKAKRTTLKLDEFVYKEAKKRAVDEDINFQELVNKALGRYLGLERKREGGELKIGDYNVGKVKTALDRKTIYEDL